MYKQQSHQVCTLAVAHSDYEVLSCAYSLAFSHVKGVESEIFKWKPNKACK